MDGPTIPSRARYTMSIRVSAAERQIMEAAAAQRPEYLTRWIVEVAMAAARRELAADSLLPPVLPTTWRSRADSLARYAPGAAEAFYVAADELENGLQVVADERLTVAPAPEAV